MMRVTSHRPEDPRELPEPDDPLWEEAPLPAASDGPREDAMRGAKCGTK